MRIIEGGVARSAEPVIRRVGTFNVSSFAGVTTWASFCRAPFPVSDLWLSSTHFSTPSGLATRYEGPSSQYQRGKVSASLSLILAAPWAQYPSRAARLLLETVKLRSRSGCENA